MIDLAYADADCHWERPAAGPHCRYIRLMPDNCTACLLDRMSPVIQVMGELPAPGMKNCGLRRHSPSGTERGRRCRQWLAYLVQRCDRAPQRSWSLRTMIAARYCSKPSHHRDCSHLAVHIALYRWVSRRCLAPTSTTAVQLQDSLVQVKQRDLSTPVVC